MPRKRKNIQVSEEAYNDFLKLRRKSGQSFIDFFDSLIGADVPESEREENKMMFLRTQFPKATGKNASSGLSQEENHKLIEDAMVKRYEESGLSLSQILQQHRDSITNSIEPVDKPDPSILDACILFTIGSNDSVSRKTIQGWVLAKMDEGWSELYPQWFKNHLNRTSRFQSTFTSRLKSLTEAGIIESNGKGIYKLSPILRPEHWTIINGINSIRPNPTMKLYKTRSGIKNLLGIE